MKDIGKRILFFAPAATPDNPSKCPFVTQRLFELQRQGYSVTVIQSGNVNILTAYETKRTGFIKLLALAYKFLMVLLNQNGGKKKYFKNDFGSYSYFDQLLFFSYKSFCKWYKKQKFVLVHAHFLWFAHLLPELKIRFAIPYVVTVHGSDMHEITLYDENKVSDALEILNNADSCIFISNYLLKHAKSLGYDAHNANVIYNGINRRVFYYGTNCDENKGEKSVLLGFVGHPIFIKRADVLPLVLWLVKKEIPNAKMVILGSATGDLLPYIKLQACVLGLQNDIEFVPSVSPEKVGDYMRKFDVLLFPSRNDGFGCVAVEAQACGVGVVASSNGGIPEAVGKNGICVPESENFIRDYANAIIDWLKKKHNPKEIAQSVKEYSWESCVKKETQIYDAIARSRFEEVNS